MDNDVSELEKLNDDYISSVQNGDVKRFNEILAQDFYCTNADKSFVDREEFLRQTALPVKIQGLKAEDVKIRLFDGFAIIHARTSYKNADGQQAYGRYTDCWVKEGGKWRAVSAHVAR